MLKRTQHRSPSLDGVACLAAVGTPKSFGQYPYFEGCQGKSMTILKAVTEPPNRPSDNRQSIERAQTKLDRRAAAEAARLERSA